MGMGAMRSLFTADRKIEGRDSVNDDGPLLNTLTERGTC